MAGDPVQQALALGLEGGFLQRIQGLTVLPCVQTALVLFQTTQATTPIVEALIERTDPPGQRGLHQIDVKFPIFAPQTTEHQIQLGSATKRLPQGTRLLAQVTAPPTLYKEINPRSTVGSVWFSTLVRRATVTIDEIVVRVDGDPGSEGEMTFALAIYDGDTGQRLTEPDFIADGDAHDGKHIGVNRTHTIANAPDSLILYAFGYESDTYDIPLPFTGIGRRGIRPPDIVPESASHGEDQYAQWADGLDTVNLPTFTTDSFSVSRQLDSIWGAISFHVRYRVSATVESRFDGPIRERFKLKTLKRTALAPGDVSGARTEAGDTHLFTTTAGGMLLYQYDSGARWRRSIPEWQSLGAAPSASLTAHTGPDGTIHLFSPDDAGTLLYRTLPGDGRPARDARWERLGGNVAGPVRAVSVDGVIELYALGRDGTLWQRYLGERFDDRWHDLGRSPGGILDVVTGGQVVHAFASDDRGTVSHKARVDGRWLPLKRGWFPLGGGFGGPVVAAAEEDGSAAVVAFGRCGEVRSRTWRDGHWDAERDAWGTVPLPDAANDAEEEAVARLLA